MLFREDILILLLEWSCIVAIGPMKWLKLVTEINVCMLNCTYIPNYNVYKDDGLCACIRKVEVTHAYQVYYTISDSKSQVYRDTHASSPLVLSLMFRFKFDHTVKRNCLSSDFILILLLYLTSQAAQRAKIWLPPLDISLYETPVVKPQTFKWGFQNGLCGYVSGRSFLALTTNIVVSPLILICSIF